MTKKDVSTSYGEMAVRGAGQAELFSMMYDMLTADLRRAITSLKDRDVERRTNELLHAQSVLDQLQTSLDLNAGGSFAESMDRLFCSVRSKLIEAQWKESAAILEEQLEAVETVRSAWNEATHALKTSEVVNIETIDTGMLSEVDASSGAEWTA